MYSKCLLFTIKVFALVIQRKKKERWRVIWFLKGMTVKFLSWATAAEEKSAGWWWVEVVSGGWWVLVEGGYLGWKVAGMGCHSTSRIGVAYGSWEVRTCSSRGLWYKRASVKWDIGEMEEGAFRSGTTGLSRASRSKWRVKMGPL